MQIDDVNAAIGLVRAHMRRLQNDAIRLKKSGLDATFNEGHLLTLREKLDALLDERDQILSDAGRTWKYPRQRRPSEPSAG